MAKELYLYSGIYDFVAQEFIQSLDDNMGNDVSIRINSPGGNVFAFWGMAAKMGEHGNVTIKVDGSAFSSAANLLLYAKRVEALDVSKAMFHRADMIVETPEQQTFLDEVNADLKAKMKAKIDGKKLKELKGITIDQLFDPEQRINLFLDAKEMKQLGLISKISKVNPSDVSAFNDSLYKIAAQADDIELGNKNKNEKEMTIEKLKAEHPDLFKEVKALGATEEKDTIDAWMQFIDIDPEAVAKGIEEGKPISGKVMAEFARKAMNITALKGAEEESAKALETNEETEKAKTDKEKEIAAFEAEAKSHLNLA